MLCYALSGGGCFRATHPRQRHPEISNSAQKCKSCRLSAEKVGRIYFEKFRMFSVCSELAAVRSQHPFPPLWRQEQSSARHYWFRVRTNIESWISFQNHLHGNTFGRKQPLSLLSSFGIQYHRDNLKGPICPNQSKKKEIATNCNHFNISLSLIFDQMYSPFISKYLNIWQGLLGPSHPGHLGWPDRIYRGRKRAQTTGQGQKRLFHRHLFQ